MKKIMFSDRFGLTQAVIEGRKTMTRRIVNLCENDLHFMKISDRGEYLFCSKTVLDGAFPRYKVGEILAVAQRYSDISDNKFFINEIAADELTVNMMKYEHGWKNKQGVKAYYMPHRIRITKIKVERLQDITDEDCLKEGVYLWDEQKDFPEGAMKGLYGIPCSWDGYLTHKKAFAALIDKVSGKGTWDRNPWVFAYEFELVKGGFMKFTVLEPLDPHICLHCRNRVLYIGNGYRCKQHPELNLMRRLCYLRLNDCSEWISDKTPFNN